MRETSKLVITYLIERYKVRDQLVHSYAVKRWKVSDCDATKTERTGHRQRRGETEMIKITTGIT